MKGQFVQTINTVFCSEVTDKSRDNVTSVHRGQYFLYFFESVITDFVFKDLVKPTEAILG